MANRSVLHINDRAVSQLIFGATDTSARRAGNRTLSRARSNIVAAGRVDTGELGRSGKVLKVPTDHPLVAKYSVTFNAPYAGWQEEGVKGPIVPKKAKALRFKPKGSSVFIFRKSVKGFPGAHFMRDALRALTIRDFLP